MLKKIQDYMTTSIINKIDDYVFIKKFDLETTKEMLAVDLIDFEPYMIDVVDKYIRYIIWLEKNDKDKTNAFSKFVNRFDDLFEDEQSTKITKQQDKLKLKKELQEQKMRDYQQRKKDQEKIDNYLQKKLEKYQQELERIKPLFWATQKNNSNSENDFSSSETDLDLQTSNDQIFNNSLEKTIDDQVFVFDNQNQLLSNDVDINIRPENYDSILSKVDQNDQLISELITENDYLTTHLNTTFNNTDSELINKTASNNSQSNQFEENFFESENQKSDFEKQLTAKSDQTETSWDEQELEPDTTSINNFSNTQPLEQDSVKTTPDYQNSDLVNDDSELTEQQKNDLNLELDQTNKIANDSLDILLDQDDKHTLFKTIDDLNGEIIDFDPSDFGTHTVDLDRYHKYQENQIIGNTEPLEDELIDEIFNTQDLSYMKEKFLDDFDDIEEDDEISDTKLESKTKIDNENLNVVIDELSADHLTNINHVLQLAYLPKLDQLISWENKIYSVVGMGVTTDKNQKQQQIIKLEDSDDPTHIIDVAFVHNY
ncbi:hypothetical protein [Mycoplasma putrefaciens]|uniref:Uncharacterized protein n=1 Tax=Mycoplasma putrefaciens (strain ATCC 15718 / NCTC 10155 / C30 KS-1 / KS-1) TaxID=743965 RepID=A0A7U3ZSN9_MYCPK|nr:hypothetical protein [Mycoplasma putrefaciens]AEM68831.1 uncharacterized protein MPUT_0459 [Mycoplasma putrefaciens KS1]